MKKILIKAPVDQEKLVLLFPLIDCFANEFGPEAQVHIVANEGLANIFEFHNHPCFFHSFPKEKDSMLGIHHFCYNLHDVFNIDYYFDYENTYKSAFMGFAFRAHERYGIKTGLNKMFLTHEVIPEKSNLYDHHYLSYFIAMGGGIPEKVPNNVVELKEAEVTAKPIFVIMTQKNERLWKDFFDCFIDQEFVIWNEHNESLESEAIKWDERNRYQIMTGINYQKVKELLSDEFKQVVSDCYFYSCISAYLGCDVFSLTSATANLPYFEHMPKEPILVKMDGEIPIKVCYKDSNVSIERMDQLVDKIVEKFKI